jgi:hypothetical protein
MKLHEALTQSAPTLLRKAKGLGEISNGDGGRHDKLEGEGY